MSDKRRVLLMLHHYGQGEQDTFVCDSLETFELFRRAKMVEVAAQMCPDSKSDPSCAFKKEMLEAVQQENWKKVEELFVAAYDKELLDDDIERQTRTIFNLPMAGAHFKEMLSDLRQTVARDEDLEDT